LFDQLFAYGHTYDHLYYTMCFIDGLCDDIKPIVLLQRPGDLHISSSLALLQEEVVEPVRKHDFKKLESGYHMKPFSKSPLPLPPPPKADKTLTAPSYEEKRIADSARPPDEKLSALKAFRKAKGLCM
jgi:hypothetical protein